MQLTKFILVLVIAVVQFMDLTNAGQAATKTAKAALEGAKKMPKVPIIAAGYTANKTHDVDINTNPPSVSYKSRPNSPKRKN